MNLSKYTKPEKISFSIFIISIIPLLITFSLIPEGGIITAIAFLPLGILLTFPAAAIPAYIIWLLSGKKKGVGFLATAILFFLWSIYGLITSPYLPR